MNPRPLVRTLTAVVGVVSLAWSSRATAADPDVPRSSSAIDTSHAAVEPARLRLMRAAMEQSLDHPRGVVEQLEPMDFAARPTFPEADRAAFLLGQAYLRLGSVTRFEALARTVSSWDRATVYTRWLATQRLLLEGQRDSTHAATAGTPPPARDSSAVADAGTGAAAANALAAGLMLREGDAQAALRLVAAAERDGGVTALTAHLRALALARAGADDVPALETLAAADTVTPLGRDLAGAALVRLASRAMERGGEGRALLERVPAGSRYAARASHMLGLEALERGDVERGTVVLDSLVAGDSSYSARREAWLAIAGAALEQGRWEAAFRTYEDIDRDWSANRANLEALLDQRSFDALWEWWRSNPEASDELMLDEAPSRMLAEQVAAASADLGNRARTEPPAPGAPPRAAAPRWPIAPPPPGAWSALAASERRVGEAEDTLGRNRWALARELERLADQRRYLGMGRERTDLEAEQLSGWATLLDSLRGRLDALDANLRAVRDAASRRVVARAGAIGAASAGSLDWIRGMRHFYIDGPDRARAVAAPGGFPGPDSVLLAEERLAQSVRTAAERMAAESPALIARSYERAWRPGLIDRATAQDLDAKRARGWMRALSASVDSSLAQAWTSAPMRLLDARTPELEQRRDALRGVDATLREDLARKAVERALASLESEREAIDYGLAAAAYGLGVHLAAADSSGTATAVAAEGASSARDTLHAGPAGEEPDDPQTARWRAEAIVRLHAFLDRHPHSPARGDMRFRLADLLLVDARQSFREQMARYLGERDSTDVAPRALPVLSHAEALELYRTILAEDRDFAHRDAVLFNAGMILADEGDPGASRFFEELVAAHPQSSYGQEAWLRMGDMRFDERRFAEGVERYARAAAGPDVTLRVIALYKMGWAHFNEDRFAEAADAFRSVLDLYGSERRAEIHVDVEGEAEGYLVHSLAGAGGAPAFAATFDRIGPRPYERRVLLSLGQHFRRYGELGQAAATDELSLSRFPLAPEALVSAQRLIETHQRSNRPALEREARLAYAPRFAPSSDWARAQASDSLRAAGADFARASWTLVALEHHRAARAGGGATEWREALALYDRLIAAWPRDAETPALELNAGEASAELGDYAAALRHYRAAAKTGPDSIAALGLWQRVAVTDAWYERSRSASAHERRAPGSDSLARAVLETGDELLARFPDHEKAADLVWRESQLAFAHGWFERAAKDLERMATRFPDDARAPVAASQRGDALFRLGAFEAAGAAFEQAQVVAQRAGRDSLERRAAAAIPVCYYRHAESEVARDSTAYARHAELFERVATRWPGFEHADLAQYRAGLAYVRADRPRDAVRAMEQLVRVFPRSEYVRDAHLEIARVLETMGEHERAGEAYADFAKRYPDDESARGAWLKAAEILAAAGLGQRAEDLKLEYVRRYPDDVETAMEIFEVLARRDLARVGPDVPLSSLLAAPRVAGAAGPAPSRLAEYMKLARAHPELASPPVLAQVRFLEGEETRTAYEAARLTQPLTKSLPARQKLLDTLLVRYRRSADLGVTEWAHASAFRIGEALVGFGKALEQCERPADLQGDDLAAYEDVLLEQSQAFTDRGEGVWTELLRQKGAEVSADAWVARAQTALWGRLANRFFYRPEVEFPVVEAKPPARDRTQKPGRSERKHASEAHRHGETKALARQEGDQP